LLPCHHPLFLPFPLMPQPAECLLNATLSFSLDQFVLSYFLADQYLTEGPITLMNTRF
jgi:hypothetical protein